MAAVVLQYVGACVGAFGTTAYLLLANQKRQEWAKDEEDNKTESRMQEPRFQGESNPTFVQDNMN